MTVFASASRTTRRPRRIPSVTALVRAPDTVRITDDPVHRPASSSAVTAHRSHDHGTQHRADLAPVGGTPRR